MIADDTVPMIPQIAPLANPPALILPALNRLHRCRTAQDVATVLASMSKDLWANLALYAARRQSIAPFIVETVVEACGPALLFRALGRDDASRLLLKYRARTVA